MPSVADLMHILLLRPVLRLVFEMHVVGREHLRRLNQFILVANHNSHLDVLLVFGVLPRRHLRRTHVVAASDYFALRPLLVRVVDYLFRPVWIDRNHKESDPLKAMADILASGDNLILFPEGTRGEPGKIASFRTGIGRLAESFREVPIVPVILWGPERSLPKGRSIPVPFYNSVVIGPPQTFTGGCVDITASMERMIRDLFESETARRQCRGSRPQVTKVIALVGIDGSGKSSVSHELVRRLSEGRRGCLISDELEFYENGERKGTQPLLTDVVRHALGRHAKVAKSLTHYKVPKLAELMLRDQLLTQVQRWYAPHVIILDGSPLINLMAWSVLYKKNELDPSSCAAAIRILTGHQAEVERGDLVYTSYPELKALERFVPPMHLADLTVMIDIDPAESIRRIEHRGGHRQVHETADKLARLRRGYLDVLRVVGDGSAPFDHVVSTALEHVHRLRISEAAHA